MSMQICYDANGKRFFMNNPGSAVTNLLFQRFPKSAPVLFGDEKESEEPMISRSASRLLVEALDEVVAGLTAEGISVYSYQIIHEIWPGHPTSGSGVVGSFKLPGSDSWYCLVATADRCYLQEWGESPGGKGYVKREIDVSDRSEIQTATKEIGTLKIKRKKQRSKVLKDLEELRDFLRSVGDVVVTIAIC